MSIDAAQNRILTKLLLTYAIIAAGLAGRSALDKVLAVRGGAELVAAWAQLSALIEMVSAVAATGVGAGLAVLAAQTRLPERQQLLLRRALALGLAITAPVAVAAAIAGIAFSERLGPALSPPSAALAALAGWIAVIHVTVNCFWQGQQRRDLMLALALVSALVSLVAAAFAPHAFVIELVVVAQALPAAVLLFVPYRTAERATVPALARYVLPGLAIGILSPLSLIVARSVVADALSWHESGVLQALWRLSDWVCSFALGVLAVLYLPRFAAAFPGGGLRPALRESARTVLLPSACLFLLLYLAHAPLLAAVYDPSFRASPLAAGLVFAGSVARIAAWIPLFGLYAASRTRAIAIGEVLSLPLFAALCAAAGDRLTLEVAGVLWLATFVVYGLFNLWALRRP